jgi:hypothetical protein
VNALVLDEFRGDGDALAAEQQSADVDGVILAERNQPVVDNLHSIVKNAKSMPIILFSDASFLVFCV